MLTGGADNMSQAPYIVRDVRFGAPLGANINFEDSLWTGLIDTHCKLPMALTAEKLGAQFNITREEVDNFSLRSQTLWKKGKHCIINYTSSDARKNTLLVRINLIIYFNSRSV